MSRVELQSLKRQFLAHHNGCIAVIVKNQVQQNRALIANLASTMQRVMDPTLERPSASDAVEVVGFIHIPEVETLGFFPKTNNNEAQS